MNRPQTPKPLKKHMSLLSRLLLPAAGSKISASPAGAELRQEILSLSREEFGQLIALADSNHVIVRAFGVLVHLLREEQIAPHGEWAKTALATEEARIANAVPYLDEICKAFAGHGYGAAVIKSLDHWPDLGSDLDMYTDADPHAISAFMKAQFNAQIAPRSWGDRLASKWNFFVPGLPEAVEIHMGRLGQTGEQTAIAASLLDRTRTVVVSGRSFRVPSIPDRLMISTLQRMYRHFYFRLCDIVDSAALADQGMIDYYSLRELASIAGIWQGAATYLVIVSDYVRQYRGDGLNLPSFVTNAARFGGDRIYYAKSFLRVPILPQSAGLYGSQLAGILGKGELHSTVRLSLLPWLATAAVVGQKLTGSDKGIW